MSDITPGRAVSRRSTHLAPGAAEVVPHPAPPRPPVPDATTRAPRWILPTATGIVGLVIGALVASLITGAVVSAQHSAEADAEIAAEQDAAAAAEGDIEASWSYHPDDGLDIIFELAE